MGDRAFGNGAFYHDDLHSATNRLAGLNFPLARSATNNVAPSGTAMSFGSYHPSGLCHYVLADGSARALTQSINTAILNRLATICNDKMIPLF